MNEPIAEHAAKLERDAIVAWLREFGNIRLRQIVSGAMPPTQSNAVTTMIDNGQAGTWTPLIGDGA